MSRDLDDFPALFVTCPTCGGSGRMHVEIKREIVPTAVGMVASGRVSLGEMRRERDGDGNVDCRDCTSRWWSTPSNRGGKVLSEFGQDLESFVRLLVEDMTAKGPDD